MRLETNKYFIFWDSGVGAVMGFGKCTFTCLLVIGLFRLWVTTCVQMFQFKVIIIFIFVFSFMNWSVHSVPTTSYFLFLQFGVWQPSRRWDCLSGIWDLASSQFQWWELARARCNVLILKEVHQWDCPVPPKGKKTQESRGEGGDMYFLHMCFFKELSQQ